MGAHCRGSSTRLIGHPASQRDAAVLDRQLGRQHRIQRPTKATGRGVAPCCVSLRYRSLSHSRPAYRLAAGRIADAGLARPPVTLTRRASRAGRRRDISQPRRMNPTPPTPAHQAAPRARSGSGDSRCRDRHAVGESAARGAWWFHTFVRRCGYPTRLTPSTEVRSARAHARDRPRWETAEVLPQTASGWQELARPVVNRDRGTMLSERSCAR
jgi:hypothetical protein